LTVSGSVTFAQLQTGTTFDADQKVVTQYEVTEANVRTIHYVQYDGVDDGYVTSTITPGIDKMQVFAGVRKLSDVALGIVAELSTSATINQGAFILNGPPSAGATSYRFVNKGSLGGGVGVSATATAPTTDILTGLGDIGGDLTVFRVDGAQVAQSSTDLGAGTYLAYPLYIGRRSGTTFPFNGRDYGLIVRFGPNLTADQITQVERWIAQETGVTL
jgi:hypothetical protein